MQCVTFRIRVGHIYSLTSGRIIDCTHDMFFLWFRRVGIFWVISVVTFDGSDLFCGKIGGLGLVYFEKGAFILPILLGIPAASSDYAICVAMCQQR